MSDQLKYEIAEKCAKRLLGIPGFSWDEANLRATAEELIEMCRGAILDNRVWSAEAQAYWLVREMRVRCVKTWTGPAAMRRVFLEKFDREQKPIGAAYETHDMGPSVPVACSICSDQGTVQGPDGRHRFCDCEAGEATTSMGESWLQLLDRTILNTPTPYERRREERSSETRTRQVLRELFGKGKAKS